MSNAETMPTAGDSSHSTNPSPDFYGSALTHIRETDKAAFESINQADFRPGSQMSRRVFRELKYVHGETLTPYLSIGPIQGSLNNCLASLEGPPGTPYAGGIFWLHVVFPNDYPTNPPAVRFVTPIYHPNIDEVGHICLNIFEKPSRDIFNRDSEWCPLIHIEMALLSVLSRMYDPELEDALMPEIAGLYREDYDTYFAVARVHTEEHAHGVRPEMEELDASLLR
ncbi:Ubiquitin-conjugating enzyme E2 [Lachnellula suecica]|uniref:Ubiquitin-conjugating enzyme E2 n=1 Tax=Lachnellula suecica TaxID=602035 RepID=A0A8T9CGZ2_9HELO|nr:Ubiquitin-conjugating enzyme E2 [Lachnellula suecica]